MKKTRSQKSRDTVSLTDGSWRHCFFIELKRGGRHVESLFFFLEFKQVAIQLRRCSLLNLNMWPSCGATVLPLNLNRWPFCGATVLY
jgi:hypothetical protein